MPLKLDWTPALDTRLRRLRAEGTGWDAVAEDLHVSRSTAISRGQRLGIPPAIHAMADTAADDDLAQPDRQSLPAGHPVTWGALTSDGFLAGTAYFDLLLQDGKGAPALALKRNKT